MKSISHVVPVLLMLSCVFPAHGDPKPLPEAPQIFVDFDRIENDHASGRTKRMRGITQEFHQAVSYPYPVLSPEAPWEKGGFTCSAIYDADEKLFKLWYLTSLPEGGNITCYATSEDGIHWKRPRLGLHEYNGSTDNNIVIPVDYREGMSHWESVLKDPLETDPAKRYKALGWSSYDWDGPLSGIYSATSPDGLTWTPTPEPVFRYHPRPGTDDLGPVGDAQSMFIDTLRGRYVAFLRSLPDRSISYSSDFKTWTPPEVVLRVPHRRMEFYNNSGFVYGDQYLGVASVFDLDPEHHIMDAWLLSSRDGKRWDRPPTGRPLVACGDIGEWNRFMCWNAGSPPIRVGDELYLYYRGSARRHGPYIGADDTNAPVCVGLAKLRADGFASLQASFDGGEFTTTPWKIEGGALRINAKSDYGRIRVELLDPDDKPLDGFTLNDCIPVTADGTDLPVQWQSNKDLATAAGTTARIRFHLENARLYSYRCQR